jgi:hypothetical protein
VLGVEVGVPMLTSAASSASSVLLHNECFKDQDLSELHIKIQSVPRSKHTPSGL